MAFGRDDLTRFVNRWWGLIWIFGGFVVSFAVICAVNMVLGAVATWEGIVFGVLTGGATVLGQTTKEPFSGDRPH